MRQYKFRFDYSRKISDELIIKAENEDQAWDNFKILTEKTHPNHHFTIEVEDVEDLGEIVEPDPNQLTFDFIQAAQ
jgi:hypothetical protein